MNMDDKDEYVLLIESDLGAATLFARPSPRQKKDCSLSSGLRISMSASNG